VRHRRGSIIETEYFQIGLLNQDTRFPNVVQSRRSLAFPEQNANAGLLSKSERYF